MIAWLAAVLLLAVAYSLGAWPAYAGEEIDPRSGRLRIAASISWCRRGRSN